MSKALALLSGKGGSGKTTLALSMAKLLTSFQIRVLFIDCDLATNGATYFFEPMYTSPVKTTYDILTNDSGNEHKTEMPLLEVENGFHFVPTSTHFPRDVEETKVLVFQNLSNYISDCSKNYDLVICDCQAGCSEELKAVLSVSDINLIVTEPDKISATAVRVLYMQTYQLLEKKKIYQLYSKITKEESKAYNSIISNFFTVIPSSIVFDWDVRTAFNFSRIPDMMSVNVRFAKNVRDVVQTLFPSFRKKFASYAESLLLEEKSQLTNQIHANKTKLQKIKDNIQLLKRSVFAFSGLLLIGLINTVFAIIGLVGLLGCAIYFGYYYFGNSEKRQKFIEMKSLEGKIKDLNSKCDSIDRKITRLNNGASYDDIRDEKDEE